METTSDSTLLFVLIGLFIFLVILSLIVAMVFPEFVGISKPRKEIQPEQKSNSDFSSKT